MKTGFVHVLWGDPSPAFWRKVRYNVENPVNLQMSPTYVYSFGGLAQKGISDIIVDTRDTHKGRFICKLVVGHNDIYPEHPNRYVWEGIRRAFSDGDLDALIYMDWDIHQVKEYPETMWKWMGNRSPLQASQQTWKRRRAQWRANVVLPNKEVLNLDAVRQCPCKKVFYTRDPSCADIYMRLWEELGQPQDDGIVLAKMTDNYSTGWKGDNYWMRYAEMPYFFPPRSPYAKRKNVKDVCFEIQQVPEDKEEEYRVKYSEKVVTTP